MNSALQPSRSIIALLMLVTLVGGLALWLHFGAIEFVYGWQRWLGLLAIVCALLAAMLPQSTIDRLAHWGTHRTELSPTKRRITAIAIGLIGAAIMYGVFYWQNGDSRPSVCDEYSYLIQAQMLSKLRLWGPAHELPEFFITFQLVADPAYGSIYLPGTSLWFAPWAWLDRIVGTGDGALMSPAPLIPTAISLALTYRCVAELLRDDRVGLLAAIILICVPMYRASAHMIVGQALSTMFCILIVYAFLKWRAAAGGERRMPAYFWALVAGVSVSWGFLSRPMDVMAYALPVLALVAGPLLSRHTVDNVRWRVRGISVLLALSTALPFLFLLLPLNRTMSGSYFQTSFGWYAETYLPGTSYGLNAERDLQAVPPNDSPDYQLSYRNFTRRFIVDHNELSTFDLFYKRFSEQLITATPHALMLATALGPLLLLILRPRETWRFALLLGAPWVLSALLYLPYGFYLGQYAVASTPSMSAAIAAGVMSFTIAAGMAFRRNESTPAQAGSASNLEVARSALSDARLIQLDYFRAIPSLGVIPSNRATVVTAVLLTGVLLALSSRGIRGLANVPREDWYQIPELRFIDEVVAREIEEPAVVFFTPPPFTQPLEAEPVYNLNVMTPDDADTVRAHDRGWRSAALVEYYARIQPERRIYHFDRRDRSVTYLGLARDLAADAEAIERMRQQFDALSAWWRPLYREAIHEFDAALLGIDPLTMPMLEDYQNPSRSDDASAF